MIIRDEQAGDQTAISKLTTRAFAPMAYSDGLEAAIIDRLRHDGDLTLSLVAVEAGEIVGHVAFSPVKIGGVDDHWLGLGPISVAVSRQRTGIGSKLALEGLSQLKSNGSKGCVLVGDPAYYSRFGFKNDGRVQYGEVSTEYVQWLAFGETLPDGNIEYRPAFN